ncbi:MAG: sulfotransferase [Gemmatimonadetes bacterium]|nr:sulfotransferase [Gemmatimonadota bacterium]
MIRSWLRNRGAADPRAHPMPIVVGSPRSGTTLLRLMLDSHPELAIPPETGFLALAPKLRGSGDSLRERFFHAVTAFGEPAPAWPDFEIPAETFREALQEISPFTAPAGFRAFYRLYAERFGKARWGDKTPLYCLQMDTIRRVLPEARFVHLVRDGRDAALSLRKMWFSPGWEIEKQAAYWRRCVLAARRAGAGRPDYLEVRYEELVLDTRTTLQRICAFVDLPYHEAMESHHLRARERLGEHKGRSAPDGTPLLSREDRLAQQASTMQAPDPGQVAAWKERMSAEDRARFRSVAGDLLRELGYEE